MVSRPARASQPGKGGIAGVLTLAPGRDFRRAHDVAAQQKRLTIALLSLASRASLASWAGGAAWGRKRNGLSRSRRLLQKAFRPMP